MSELAVVNLPEGSRATLVKREGSRLPAATLQKGLPVLMQLVKAGNGTPEMGIALRAQLSPQDKQHYTCMWSFKTKALTLYVTQGGSPTALMTKTVPEAGAAIPLTMEARVAGTALACCLREYPTATLMGVTDATITAGYPGLQTNREAAAFGSFAVTQ